MDHGTAHGSSQRLDVQVVDWKPFHFPGPCGTMRLLDSSALFAFMFTKMYLSGKLTCWTPSCLTELNGE